MFVGCSEDSIIVIFKHVQHVGIITTFCVPGEIFLNFVVPGGQKKWLGCGVLGVGGLVLRVTL